MVEKSDITSFDCCDKNAVYKPDKQIYEKYLVKNTTVKERKRYVEKLNGRWYSITAPFNGYIKGKCEIDEGFKLIWREFLREEKKKLEISDVRRQSRVSRAFDEIGEILAAMTEIAKARRRTVKIAVMSLQKGYVQSVQENQKKRLWTD